MVYPSRKHSVPENFHKPPSPKENDVGIDPLADKHKQSSVVSTSSIKPPSMLQPPFVLQQQQQPKAMVSQTKPSPPLLNKRSTSIPRKPVALSAKNHAIQSDMEYYQMDLPKSHSNDELSAISMPTELSSNSEPLSPPPVIMEDQSERTFTFPNCSSSSQQQVKILSAVL